jgi:hypothetical protein
MIFEINCSQTLFIEHLHVGLENNLCLVLLSELDVPHRRVTPVGKEIASCPFPGFGFYTLEAK